jgi:hypothetical protein
MEQHQNLPSQYVLSHLLTCEMINLFENLGPLSCRARRCYLQHAATGYTLRFEP